ncbi:hypothetical protein Tco_1125958 [Tanacetum coccineum]
MRARHEYIFYSLPLSQTFILSPTRPDAQPLGIPPPLHHYQLLFISTIATFPIVSKEDKTRGYLPPRKRPAGGLRADYGFVATIDREIRRDPEREDTNEVYTRLDDEQCQRQLLAGRLNMLFRDRRAHAYTRHKIETKARLSREAWRRSMDANDLARGEVISLRTTVLGQMSEIRELHAGDRRRQADFRDAKGKP